MSQRHRFQAIAAIACAIAAAAALEGSSALSAPSEKARAATVPGKNGRIAFKRVDSGRGAIFTTDADGKAERRITRPEPAWWTTSPTGRRMGRCSSSTAAAPPSPSTR